MLAFTKMQGIGNDFVVIDAINQPIALTSEQARKLADRRFGVGCDQILLVEKPHSADVEFRYRILNADGSEVAQCGNGARCFARFVRDKGLTDSDEIPVETDAGRLLLKLQADGQVQVDMGAPVFDPAWIPFHAEKEAVIYEIEAGDERVEISALSMGNPHAVLLVDDVDSAAVERLGPLLESHPRFAERANIGFMQVMAKDHIRLRVYERGAGETLACGSGACAAVAAGRLRNLLNSKVKVDLPGGRLMIEWQGNKNPVLMTGPAETVFEGSINL
ncbi:MAG TPA: diaminopimelate epimerase [Chromatiales bacterium]|nr:diaminopimelate epimerase [Chromatiales bacterium]